MIISVLTHIPLRLLDGKSDKQKQEYRNRWHHSTLCLVVGQAKLSNYSGILVA